MVQSGSTASQAAMMKGGKCSFPQQSRIIAKDTCQTWAQAKIKSGSLSFVK